MGDHLSNWACPARSSDRELFSWWRTIGDSRDERRVYPRRLFGGAKEIVWGLPAQSSFVWHHPFAGSFFFCQDVRESRAWMSSARSASRAEDQAGRRREWLSGLFGEKNEDFVGCMYLQHSLSEYSPPPPAATRTVFPSAHLLFFLSRFLLPAPPVILWGGGFNCRSRTARRFCVSPCFFCV